MTKEATMRKIVAGLTISLDGVVESPANWGFQFMNEEMNERIRAGIAQADAILLGRRTYLEFAELWPKQPSEVPMADFLNQTPKYVVSGTLDRLDWGPATPVTGDLVEAITTLKHQPGKNIQIPGSPTLVRWLLQHGLLDELALMVCPVAVTSGMRLFDELTDPIGFELVAASPLSTGALAVTYKPASADGESIAFPDAAARQT
jgi:dihydrofolate reductase